MKNTCSFVPTLRSGVENLFRIVRLEVLLRTTEQTAGVLASMTSPAACMTHATATSDDRF
jgi:hypothetical protein